MTSTRSVQQMIDTARGRADLHNSEFVDATEAMDELNYGNARLWQEIEAVDPDHWHKLTTIVTVAGTTSYALPADFRALRRLDRVEGSTRVMIEPFHLLEVDRSAASSSYAEVGYRVMGNGTDGSERKLHLLPDPGAYTYELLYVQAPQRFTDVSDVFDGEAGWERYSILHLARHMRQKADRPTDGIEREMAEVLDLVQAMARKRDAARPPRIQDVRSGRTNYGRRTLPGPP